MLLRLRIIKICRAGSECSFGTTQTIKVAETEELGRQNRGFPCRFLEFGEFWTGHWNTRACCEGSFSTYRGWGLLTASGGPASGPRILDTTEIREINKITIYWRICHSLSHLSGSYRTLFSRIKLESLKPFALSVRHGNSKTRYVHAEVQIIVY